MVKKIILLFFCLLQGCSLKYQSREYFEQYCYLQNLNKLSKNFSSSEYYIVFLVDAKHFDYSDSQNFLKTFTKHPLTGNKECSYGHAWLILKGPDFILEGGHSGELGQSKPKYMDGVASLQSNKDPNPIKYLWESLDDGFFQRGNGGHSPTFAAKIIITKEEFNSILSFIKSYPYKNYSLTSRQCISFIKQIAALIDISLETDAILPFRNHLSFMGKKSLLWSDDKYCALKFPSPEILERSLIHLVQVGKAENALNWYKKNFKISKESIFHKMKFFYYRLRRYYSVDE